MTKEDLQRLATWQPERSEPLQRTEGKDTYKIVEVFRDTSFLTKRSRKKEDEHK